MQLLTKSFLFMFDPHRTRYNDRRFFTRKGQILQAKKVDPPFSIEQRKVEAYKQYLLLNHLIQAEEIPYYHPPAPGPTKIIINAITVSNLEIPTQTNQLNFSGPEGMADIDLSGIIAPRLLVSIRQLEQSYKIVLYMIGDLQTFSVDPNTYYVFYGLNGLTGDYELKFLSDQQAVLDFHDQVDQIDNTELHIPKSKYTIVLPA